MAAKKGFSERAWDEIINGDMNGDWIDGVIEAAKQRPDDPFADSGPLLQAMLKNGVTREQIARLARHIRYETVFETVQLAAEEELDGDQLGGVHEELLMADPSGKDGRPGSWPIKSDPPPNKQAKLPKSSKRKPADPDAPLLKLPKADDFAFAPDGKRLWLAHTSVNSSTVRGIELPGGEQFAEFNSLPNLRGIACSGDGKRLAVSNHYGVVALHDSASGKQLWASPKTGQENFHLAYAPDGSMVMTSAVEQIVRRYDGKSGKELPPLDVGENSSGSEMAFSPDGKRLALMVSGEKATFITYWDWRAGKELARKRCGDGAINSIAFLPDGRRVLAGEYREISVWEVGSGKLAYKFPVDRAGGVSVHASGRFVAVDSYGGAEIRELPSGKVLKQLQTATMYPDDFAFSPDGAHVLLVASPKSFLWSVETLLANV